MKSYSSNMLHPKLMHSIPPILHNTVLENLSLHVFFLSMFHSIHISLPITIHNCILQVAPFPPISFPFMSLPSSYMIHNIQIAALFSPLMFDLHQCWEGSHPQSLHLSPQHCHLLSLGFSQVHQFPPLYDFAVAVFPACVRALVSINFLYMPPLINGNIEFF